MLNFVDDNFFTKVASLSCGFRQLSLDQIGHPKKSSAGLRYVKA